MMVGIINVSRVIGIKKKCQWWLTSAIVHAEPGEDKITFANDVAKWILDRAGPASGAISKEAPTAGPIIEASPTTDESEDLVETKSRL